MDSATTVDQLIPVLDKGYVRLVDSMGTDLTVANAARVSYLKKAESLTDADRKLIAFLAREGHTSPFRHGVLQYEIKAPIMVRSQWAKYVVGGEQTPPSFVAHPVEEAGTGMGDDTSFNDPLRARNEASRRYVTLDMEYLVPQAHEWRSRPANSKQGSGDPVPVEVGEDFTRRLEQLVLLTQEFFDDAQAAGICAEQARLGVLGYAIYATWYWTISLQGVAHFLEQRLEHDAQKEIQEYAKAIYALSKPLFPVSLEELIGR